MSAVHANANTWRHIPEARPLRAWREDDLREVAGRTEGVLRAWAAEWGVPRDPATAVRCPRAEDGKSGLEGWIRVGRCTEGGAWIRWTPEADAWLACAWFGAASAATPVVAAVVQCCRQDFLQRLSAGLGLLADPMPAPPAPDLWERWSGALVAMFSWGAEVLVEAGVVSLLWPPQAHRRNQPGERLPDALVGIGQALAGTELRLRAELDGCELALGDLQGLQLGDVLRLRHCTDSPAMVRPLDGDVLFSGWLACSRGRRAVELAPAAVPRTHSPVSTEPT